MRRLHSTVLRRVRGQSYRGEPVVDCSPGLVFHRDVRCSCFSTASAAKTPPSNVDVPGSGTTVTAALLLAGAKSGDTGSISNNSDRGQRLTV